MRYVPVFVRFKLQQLEAHHMQQATQPEFKFIKPVTVKPFTRLCIVWLHVLIVSSRSARRTPCGVPNSNVSSGVDTPYAASNT